MSYLIKWMLLLFSHVLFFCDPVTVAHQAPRSMGFPRQEHWSGVPSPSSGFDTRIGIKIKERYRRDNMEMNPHLSGQGF